MSLPPPVGHGQLRERLRMAADAGRLPQSLLFYGPAGTGKERLALWLAAMLQCERGTACGECRSCRLAARLEHPDIHWHFPMARPAGSSRRKERESWEEARHGRLGELREDPFAPSEETGATGIYLAAVEVIREAASRRPAMGPRAIFVLGDADAMVPQAASPAAANAFLKLLEEPPADTFFLLTSSRPGALLPTIRSRVLSVRVPPLDQSALAEFLQREMELPVGRASELARRAGGSVGRAVALLRERDDEPREDARKLVRAALSGRRSDALGFAATVGPSGARGEFSEILESAERVLRDLLAVLTDAPATAVDPEAVRELLGGRPAPHAHGILRALEALEEAGEAAAGNVNPQAVAAVLLSRMSRALAAPAETPRAGLGTS